MNRPDVVEIWIGNEVLLRIFSGFAPEVGELLNIQSLTYRVVGRSFTIDRAGDIIEAQMRCNVIVERADV